MFSKKKRSELDELWDKVSSMERILKFHDHARVNYVNDPFYNRCYFYKDGAEYRIDGLQLHGNVKIYGQQNSDFDHIVMATCNIDSNDEEAGHEEQYVINLKELSFIRTE